MANKERARAFTFVEVVVALTIVSISLLALLRLHLISIRAVSKAQVKTQAVFLANEKIAEKINDVSLNFSSPIPCSPLITPPWAVAKV